MEMSGRGSAVESRTSVVREGNFMRLDLQDVYRLDGSTINPNPNPNTPPPVAFTEGGCGGTVGNTFVHSSTGLPVTPSPGEVVAARNNLTRSWPVDQVGLERILDLRFQLLVCHVHVSHGRGDIRMASSFFDHHCRLACFR